MLNNVSQFVPILDGSNYGIWSSAMRAFLMFLGLWAHATGTTAAPVETLDATSVTVETMSPRLRATIECKSMPLRGR
jgi:hypothetical protein